MSVTKVGIARRGDLVVLQYSGSDPSEILQRCDRVSSETGVRFAVIAADGDAAIQPYRPRTGRTPRWLQRRRPRR